MGDAAKKQIVPIDPEYWRPIAKGIDLDDSRLKLYVKHKGSLGVGRETILRKVLIDQTPEPFRVRTGFVATLFPELKTSDQCDIVVYDPTVRQPHYKIEEFVVIDPSAARMVIEVRSHLTVGKGPRTGLNQAFQVCSSIRTLGPKIPTFAFGFYGARCTTFATAIAQRINGNIFNIPECIVVHHRNYLALRITDKFGPNAILPRVCIIADFNRSKVHGFATAVFLEMYSQKMKKRVDEVQYEGWQNFITQLGLPADAVSVIHENGLITNGPLPDLPLIPVT